MASKRNDCVIATIDGPSASGKSTVARLVADRLNWIYVDSGSLYRGITWHFINQRIGPSQTLLMTRSLKQLDLQCFFEARQMRFTIDGLQPGDDLRSEAVNEQVSAVAEKPQVRKRVVKCLHAMTGMGNLVVEGRDIGSAVFPRARFKFYLDAAPEERARRRHAELVRHGETLNVDRVSASLQRRDLTDSRRKTAPLTVPRGAVVIDTTALSIRQVVARIVRRIRPDRP